MLLPAAFPEQSSCRCDASSSLRHGAARDSPRPAGAGGTALRDAQGKLQPQTPQSTPKIPEIPNPLVFQTAFTHAWVDFSVPGVACCSFPEQQADG